MNEPDNKNHFIFGSLHDAWIKPRADHSQDQCDNQQDNNVSSQSCQAGASCQHQGTYAINDISQRIDVGDDLQPTGHDRYRIDGVAGEE